MTGGLTGGVTVTVAVGVTVGVGVGVIVGGTQADSNTITRKMTKCFISSSCPCVLIVRLEIVQQRADELRQFRKTLTSQVI